MPYTYGYPRPAVTTDALIFRFCDGQLHILLIKRKFYPFEQMWALPGGFVDIDEPLEDTAARELEEEAGLSGIPLMQTGAYGRPGRDPRTRIITVAFCGFAAPGHSRIRAGDDAGDARWWPTSDLPETAFDHDEIISDALDAIRRRACFGLEHCKMLGRVFDREDFVALHTRIFGGDYDVDGFFDRMVLGKKIRPAGKGKFCLSMP